VAKRKRNNRVNIHQAKTHLSRLIERVEAGESIIICRAGQPVAELAAVSGSQPPVDRPSLFGSQKGKIWYAPDAFAPMSDEELKLWYDAPLTTEPARQKPARARSKRRGGK
jgi:prevent-host-death family protein